MAMSLDSLYAAISTMAGVLGAYFGYVAVRPALRATRPRPEASPKPNAPTHSAVPLVVSSALLIAPLVVYASDSFYGYLQTWPWWIAAGTAFLGLSAAALGMKQNLTFAVILAINLCWLLTYAIILLAG